MLKTLALALAVSASTAIAANAAGPVVPGHSPEAPAANEAIQQVWGGYRKTGLGEYCSTPRGRFFLNRSGALPLGSSCTINHLRTGDRSRGVVVR
jgi:hypothetical protein